MGRPYFISVPCGLTRTQEIIDLNQRIQALGKDVTLHAFDTVQGLQWNAGRLITNKLLAGTPMDGHQLLYDITVDDLPEAIRRVKRLNDHGIAFNLTVNNVLESIDVDDEDGNYLLRNIENDMNWVTVATRGLTQHVKAHHPRLKMTGSICFAYSSLEEYQRACGIYDLVVLLPHFAYQPEVLTQLPLDKISFILNDWCNLFCYRKDHYEAMSRSSLAGNSTVVEQERNWKTTFCNHQIIPNYGQKLPAGADKATCLRIAKMAAEQIRSDGDLTLLPGGQSFNISRTARRGLLDLGINHFKLQGREMLAPDFQRKVVGFLEAFVRDEL